MAKKRSQKLTLYQPAAYQIKVPGHLDASWVAWDERITAKAASEEDGTPVTVLTATLDQAALQGLLRRLYGLGLPLISVIHIETGEAIAYKFQSETKSRKGKS